MSVFIKWHYVTGIPSTHFTNKICIQFKVKIQWKQRLVFPESIIYNKIINKSAHIISRLRLLYYNIISYKYFNFRHILY